MMILNLRLFAGLTSFSSRGEKDSHYIVMVIRGFSQVGLDLGTGVGPGGFYSPAGYYQVSNLTKSPGCNVAGSSFIPNLIYCGILEACGVDRRIHPTTN